MNREPTSRFSASAEAPEGDSPSGPSPLARRSAAARLGHVLAWTLLFYLLTYGIAKLCEWLARL